ncbi:MAG: hypothetical protein Q9160_004697 [Pyrenula sp. 1 TL-2023]
MTSFGLSIRSLIVLITLLHLVTCTNRPETPPTRPRGSSNDNIVYAAVGGSWAAGVPNGEELHPGSPCKQYTSSYPILASSQLGIKPTNFHFLACANHDIFTIIGSQVPHIPSNATLVSISAGLDLLNFGDVVQACDADTDGDKCEEALSRAFAMLYLESTKGSLYRGMHLLVTAIQQQAPSAAIVILGFPRWLGSPVRDCHDDTSVRPDRKEVTQAQRDRINEVALESSAVLSLVAGQTRSKQRQVVFQDPDTDWTNHRYCDEEREGAWLVQKNGINRADAWASGYYHPNEDGQVEMKNLLIRAMQQINLGL